MSMTRVTDEPDETLLSALVDGELNAQDTAQACALWRSSVRAQAQWQDYQLIGDVLRSEDLARNHDEVFLARLRAELAHEPVILAPMPEVPIGAAQSAKPGQRFSGWSWGFSSVAAAGVLMVGASWLMSPHDLIGKAQDAPIAQVRSASEAIHLATDGVAASVGAADAASGLSGNMGLNSQAVVANDVLVRDPSLDRYLAAHKQFSSTSVLGSPSSALRQVVVESTGR